MFSSSSNIRADAGPESHALQDVFLQPDLRLLLQGTGRGVSVCLSTNGWAAQWLEYNSKMLLILKIAINVLKIEINEIIN